MFFNSGRCIGPLIHTSGANSTNECLALCQEEELCQYFTFHETDLACTLTTECTYYDLTCDECVYGQVHCEPLEEKGTLKDSRKKNFCTVHQPLLFTGQRLLVLGGNPGLKDVEVVDLDRDDVCSKPADLPLITKYAVGGAVNGKPVICGGLSIPYCYEYSAEGNYWETKANIERQR